jgi:8-oxo-dGTP pyrophosphatase MutT (NUDIX family)
LTEPVKPRLAATLMLARDGAEGLELFMVVRHHEIEFASGALVFPGGSAHSDDSSPSWRALADGAEGLDDAKLALMAAAAREAFEECGVLFARSERGGPRVDGTRAEALGRRYRQAIESETLGFSDMMAKEGLVAAFDQLVHFAHWVTPAHMPKRFDTHFFLARAPLDHILAHDGGESVDSVWITPRQACAEGDAGSRTLLFPTRLNLEKVGRHRTVDEALAAARAARVVTVRPEVRMMEQRRVLCIPAEAGYGGGEFLVEGAPGKGTRIRNADGSERPPLAPATGA